MAAHDTHTSGGRKPFTNQVIYRNGVYVGALTGDIVLTKLSAQFLKLDPAGAARDVTLPALESGLVFHIVNSADAAENLVVKNAAGTTIVTISQNESVILVSDASAWTHLGIVTIALS